MQAFVETYLLVCLAELGDKTQLLALFLAAKYRARGALLGGIFLAALANHGLAAFFGSWLFSLFGEEGRLWLIGGVFFAFGIWLLIPEKGKDEEIRSKSRFGPFSHAFVLFFLAEMGDKTQIAAALQAGRFGYPLIAALASSLALLSLSAVAIFAGAEITRKVPILWLRRVGAGIAFGVWAWAFWKIFFGSGGT